MIKNPISDYRPQSDKLFGIFRGIVEDNKDPEKAGRARIRVFGVHTSLKRREAIEGVPTNELPWFEPCLGLIEGSISGFGFWGVPLQGSHVAVFFENGNIMQGRFFASLPGIPQTAPNINQGFNDPDGVYPKSVRLEQPDVHRLARGESSLTIVDYKNDNLDIGAEIAFGGTWDEPNPSYAAQYPHNLVLATHGGILTEWDSTPDARRFHIYHPSNSYIEISEDGTMIIRNNKDKFEIVISNKNSHIKGSKNTTVDQDNTLKVGGNHAVQVTGNRQDEIGGDLEAETKGTEKHKSGNRTEEINGNWDITISGNINITVTGNCNITSTGQCSIQGTDGLNLISSGECAGQAAVWSVQAGIIQLN